MFVQNNYAPSLTTDKRQVQLSVSVNEQLKQNVTQLEKWHEEILAKKDNREHDLIPVFTEAYRTAIASEQTEWIIKIAGLYSSYLGEVSNKFDEGIRVIDEVLAKIPEGSYIVERAELIRKKGLHYSFSGNIISSKVAYEESLNLLRKEPELDKDGMLTQARSAFNLSIIYDDLGLKLLAEKLLDEAYQFFKKTDYQGGISRCLISFGVKAYVKPGHQVDEVLAFYRDAAAIAKEENDFPPYCTAMGNIGIVCAENGRFTEALEAANEALALSKTNTNIKFQHNLSRQLGRIYQLKGDYENSHLMFSEAEQLLSKMGSGVDKVELYKYWAEVLHAMKRHEEAYEKLSLYVKHQDELQDLGREAAVNDAMLKLQFEEGRKEQEILRKKNLEIEEYARKLEISNFELKQFAHVASHDLKEPLRMIANYSQLLTRTLGDNLSIQQATFLKYINEGSRRMMDMINDLLQLSKINSIDQREEVDLNALTKSVVEAIYLENHSRAIQVTIDEMPTIKAHATHINQLLHNIIHNAIKYNKNDIAQVHVHSTLSANGHTIMVDDNGIGIQKQHRDRVFIIFQRLHNRNEYDGTGIGLAICKKIVDHIGGTIWIEDSPLGGSRFCFSIPN